MNTEQNSFSSSPLVSPIKKSLRGFAAMSAEKQREIARKGGKAAHERGTAHEFTPDEARVAGRKGGEIVSRNRDHMAAIGREGGKSHRKNHLGNGDSVHTPTPGDGVMAPSNPDLH